MTIYVRVHRPARRRDEAGGQSQPAGFYHGLAGEVAGFTASTGVIRAQVLVALEDGSFETFAPSELRRVGVNQGFLQKLQ